MICCSVTGCVIRTTRTIRRKSNSGHFRSEQYPAFPVCQHSNTKLTRGVVFFGALSGFFNKGLQRFTLIVLNHPGVEPYFRLLANHMRYHIPAVSYLSGNRLRLTCLASIVMV
jgi:hypothetical protein